MLHPHFFHKKYSFSCISHLSYCVESWDNALPSNLHPIVQLQNKVVKIICKQKSGSDAIYKQLGILSLKKLYHLRILEQAYKSFYSYPASYTYHTRHSLWSLPLPPSTTQAGHRRVSYQAAASWNGLPVYLRQIENFTQFQQAVKKHLLTISD